MAIVYLCIGEDGEAWLQAEEPDFDTLRVDAYAVEGTFDVSRYVGSTFWEAVEVRGDGTKER